jgi:hypothetical protein
VAPVCAPGLHELEQRHLGGCVLHRDAVDAEERGALAALELLSFRIVEMGEEDLLRVGERTLQTRPKPLVRGIEALVEGADGGVGYFDHGVRIVAPWATYSKLIVLMFPMLLLHG